jgi:hypothetical protein
MLLTEHAIRQICHARHGGRQIDDRRLVDIPAGKGQKLARKSSASLLGVEYDLSQALGFGIRLNNKEFRAGAYSG